MQPGDLYAYHSGAPTESEYARGAAELLDRAERLFLMLLLDEGCEGFDINDPHDWMMAERLLADGDVKPPRVSRPPYGSTGGSLRSPDRAIG